MNTKLLFRGRIGIAETIAWGMLLAVGLWGGCGSKKGSDSSAGTPLPKTFRVVFLADTHVIGPQYTCCSENSPADNSSIVKTVDRLKAVRDIVNSIDPPPAMAFVLGDIVHAAYHSKDIQWYRDNPNAFSVARDIFKTFHVPVHIVLGNHDYGVGCPPDTDVYDRELTHSLFKEFFDTPPYQSVDYAGWRFLLTNGQLGPTWDASNPRCDTDKASLGKEQMDWAEAQLAENKPTIVMSHYMRFLFDDKEEGASNAFPTLLEGHKNVQGFLAGHTHRWLDLTDFNNNVLHQVLGATRYDSDNFWLVEFDTNLSTFRVLDQAKGRPSNSCADTWSYDGTPTIVKDAPENGDCVSGIEQ